METLTSGHFSIFQKAARRAEKSYAPARRLVQREGFDEAMGVVALAWVEMQTEGQGPPEGHPDPTAWWVVALAFKVSMEGERRYGKPRTTASNGSVARWEGTAGVAVHDGPWRDEHLGEGWWDQPGTDPLADPEHVAEARDEYARTMKAIKALHPGQRRALLEPFSASATRRSMNRTAGQRQDARKVLRAATGRPEDRWTPVRSEGSRKAWETRRRREAERKRKRAYTRARRQDPAYVAEERERTREYMRERRASDPAFRARQHAATDAWEVRNAEKVRAYHREYQKAWTARQRAAETPEEREARRAAKRIENAKYHALRKARRDAEREALSAS